MFRVALAVATTGGALYTAQRYLYPSEHGVAAAAHSSSTALAAEAVPASLPSRAHLLLKLKTTPTYDVVVVGGGATGSGIALDAATRGLSVALIERDDFASGTSSKSTKLIHGGIRYLEAAAKSLDRESYKLVKEALHERATLLHIAPHLTRSMPFILPVYHWWQVPYYWAGVKAYDLVAGSRNLASSYYMGPKRTREMFPLLNPDRLVGSLVYYDGQMDDSRMALSIALTAISHGADVANHVEVISLLKRDDIVYGVQVQDRLTGEKWDIRAKVVINATGPYVDKIRVMDNEDVKPLITPSLGTHIALPSYYSPAEGKSSFIIPSSDGRVLFLTPWKGVTLAGTTDVEQPQPEFDPRAPEQDVDFILRELAPYLTIPVERRDVLSVWTGIRPLVREGSIAGTASISRSHLLEISPSRLITITGGKWTTYRNMADETLKAALDRGLLACTSPCVTARTMLIGGERYHPSLYAFIAQRYGLPSDIAEHLTSTYGDQAAVVAELAKATPTLGRRLQATLPFIEAEIVHAVRNEYALTLPDMLGRRLRVSFTNIRAADEIAPRVAELMAAELKWSRAQKNEQLAQWRAFRDSSMGLQLLDTKTAASGTAKK